MKKSKKLFIIPMLASTSVLGVGLTTTVSCSNNNNKIVIDNDEVEQKALSNGLAVYSFNFKGDTLPDSRRFVSIQLTEISIQSDSEVKSVAVLNIIGKDEIVIHDDGHFDVPVTFINPYQFSGKTTVKFQLKFRYRLGGNNIDEIVENLVIKYFNSTPAPSDVAIFKLNGIPKVDPTKYEEGLFFDVPLKLIKDLDGYPFAGNQIKSIECDDLHVRTRFVPEQLTDTFDLSLQTSYAPVYDYHYNFNLYITYIGANGVEKTSTIYNISFDYHPPVFTKGEVLLVSSSEPQIVGAEFKVSYKYVDPIPSTRSVSPISHAMLYDPKTGYEVDGVTWETPKKSEAIKDNAYPFKITVTITDPTKPLTLTFGLCITINSTKCIADTYFTFIYTP